MTTNIKELLTYAAKVAGFEYRSIGNKIFFERNGYLMGEWNPHTDDGDKNAALRMATLKLAAEIGRSKEQHSHCACPACRDGTIHASDCSVHNEPAMRNGPCDCGVKEAKRD